MDDGGDNVIHDNYPYKPELTSQDEDYKGDDGLPFPYLSIIYDDFDCHSLLSKPAMSCTRLDNSDKNSRASTKSRRKYCIEHLRCRVTRQRA